mmetsp:Transcript_48843/g.151358  ORF Transcript_48843/g.151358 Transcript_48843/m.151358 type:complete len:276 (+) Transcript_48843:110-937(+)
MARPGSSFTAHRRFAARQARLVWYVLGCTAALVLLQRSVPAFVPAPGSVAATARSSGRGEVEAVLAATGAALLAPAEVLAKEGKWGALEGKTSSLVHPVIMPLLFLATFYTGFLGWQWRQTRLIGAEVADLRKQIPKEEDPEAEPSSAVKALKAQIAELSSERSALIKGNFKDQHFQMSSLLLGGGIFFTVYGVFNTWFRTEKLFPGPHLFAGAAICVGWALAAACVPFMEKGNEAARNVHIALNVIILALFAWQLPTGFEILQKVWGNANLPWF